jgi:hypothetical protein
MEGHDLAQSLNAPPAPSGRPGAALRAIYPSLLPSAGFRSYLSRVRRVDSLRQRDDGFEPPSDFGRLLPRSGRCVPTDGAASVGPLLKGLARPSGKMDQAGATSRNGSVSH